jgi:hypothetical protein
MRWRLVLEEYGPELRYIKGEHNIIADALSRLDLDDSIPRRHQRKLLDECFNGEGVEFPSEEFPPYGYTQSCSIQDRSFEKTSQRQPAVL